jgi:hypothetical protein
MKEMKFPQAVTTPTVGIAEPIERSISMALLDTPYERVTAPDGFLWPGDRRIAVVFNIAYEMWTPGATSGVGPMGNMLSSDVFDPNADSYGKYNATAGAARLLDIATRNGIAASVLTSGMVAERYADHVKRMAEAGHEIIGHAYAQNLISPTLSSEEDTTSIRVTTDFIATATGVQPQG